MAFKFTDASEAWADEISSETTKGYYQNALIRIQEPAERDPNDYDEETATWTLPASTTLYSGQARIIGVRWGVNSGGESQNNAMTLSAIRVQIPRGSFAPGIDYGDGIYGDGPYGSSSSLLGRVKKGVKIFVDVCERNPALQDLIFTVTSDLQGSMSASRTFQAALDGDVRKA